MIDTDTTLCTDCGIPIDAPKAVPFSPFLSFLPPALCKDCFHKAELVKLIEWFEHAHCRPCPYQVPKWRPKG